MGLIRYLRRRLHIQQVNDVCDSTHQIVDKCLKEICSNGGGIQAKLDQTIQIQKSLKETGEAILQKAEQNTEYRKLRDLGGEVSSKADQAISGQQELKKKADQSLALEKDFGDKAGKILARQQELKNTAEQAVAGQQELKKKADQSLALEKDFGDKAGKILAGQQELDQKVDRALLEVQQLKSDLQKVLQSIEHIRRTAVEGSRYASEAVWGELFNQVSDGSSWLKDRRFAAGRWAVGYQYLYAVYRILNEVHPKNILELGLGQSTKLISQYAAAYPEVHHQVVEHDPEWMDFFRKNYKLPSNTQMVQLVWDFIPYKWAEHVRAFKNFAETFKDQKFDFISIDAPFGGDMNQYARIDVLKILPDCLAESFIIIIDDAERIGETHTVKEMSEVLKEFHIPFATGRYSGKKDCIVICSENMKFVCSM